MKMDVKSACVCVAWNVDQLSSGCRHRLILQRDVRAPPAGSQTGSVRTEVEQRPPAAGVWRNDNKLLVWSLQRSARTAVHRAPAAVKVSAPARDGRPLQPLLEHAAVQ